MICSTNTVTAIALQITRKLAGGTVCSNAYEVIAVIS